jgi:CRP-like cAMP-binding protein
LLVEHFPEKAIPTYMELKLARRSNRLLSALPSKALELLRQDMRQISLQRGVVCFEAGQVIDRVYFPLTGMISLLSLQETAR